MENVYAKLDRLGEGSQGVGTIIILTSDGLVWFRKFRVCAVNLAIDLRVLAQLRSSQACADYKELAREMRVLSDERAELKTKRMNLDQKHNTPPEAFVALKKIMVKEAAFGVSMDAIREIKILQELNSDYVLKILDIYQMDSNINVVLPFMRGDLFALLANPKIILQPADVKAYLKMLLLGVSHCHQNFILHRDIKPVCSRTFFIAKFLIIFLTSCLCNQQNCLLSTDGKLKLADFGLARPIASPERNMSPRVFTIWYRAPELLFGSRSYGFATDIWACGCIFAQLILRRPLFVTSQENELEQLHVIFQALGAPNEKNWPGVETLPHYLEHPNAPAEPVLWKSAAFSALSADALDLLKSMLSLDPCGRPTAEQALQHAYFTQGVQPTACDKLPKF
jgi:cyclin-dependent kinase 7